MKKLILPLVLGILCVCISNVSIAQTAKVQIIHNAPDPAADSVDIYINMGAAPAIEDLKFREATAFIDLPAGVVVNVGIAPGNSTGPQNIIASYPLTLTANENYVATAAGVLPTSLANYDQTANGMAISFDVKIQTPADTNAMAGMVSLAVFHGATDVDSVDVIANGGATPLINDLQYGGYQGYVSVPAAKYVLDITPYNDNSTIAASYYVDLSGLGGGAAVVFASGFLNPANNQNGAAFGLFAALPDGTVLPLTAVGTAKVQVIHNSADPVADSVDIYVDIIKDIIKLDNVAFRTATAFLDLPAGYPIDIVVAAKTSASIADGLATFSPTLVDGSTSLAIASGVLNLMGSTFAANPDGILNDFTLLLTDGKESGTAGNLDVKVVHGSTDAPSVGINANGGALLDSVAYQDISAYTSVPAVEYRIDVTGANDPTNVLFPYYLDASGLGGQTAAVLASGFLTPSANENGAAFGLFAVLPTGGEFIPLTAVGNARAQIIHNAADPGAATVDVYINTRAGIVKVDDFMFRTATPYVDLPTGYPVEVVIALPTSTSIDSGVVATFPITAAEGEVYHIVANGVLDSTSFALNPEMRPTSFNLYVNGGGREAATDPNKVDIRVFHGATDAPSVDVTAFGLTSPLVSGAVYTDITGYLNLDPASYQLNITPAGNNNTVVASFTADVSMLGGGAGVILASGFLDPTANQNGDGFGLLVVLPDTAFMLSNVTSIGPDLELAQDLIDVYPNPASDQVLVSYKLEESSDLKLELMDTRGRIIYGKQIPFRTLGQLKLPLEVAQYPAGIYTVILTTETTRSTKKVLVRK